MSIATIGVVGAGQMGSGIAHVAALAGYDVVVQDVAEHQLASARTSIEKNLARQVGKEQISAADATAALARIDLGAALDRLSRADLVVEAATENVALKSRIFEDIARVAPAHAILASNTSSISITALAVRTGRPDKVIGMHFMNPVPVMKLVEVIRGLATSDETTEAVLEVAARMGKTTVQSKDMPGFVVNRVLMPYINEAVFALHEGIATAGDVDTAMKLGTNVPMGPLQLADFIGLDTCLAILEVLQDGLGDPKYRPCPLLRKYVEAGWLGKKSGRGFYVY